MDPRHQHGQHHEDTDPSCQRLTFTVTTRDCYNPRSRHHHHHHSHHYHYDNDTLATHCARELSCCRCESQLHGPVVKSLDFLFLSASFAIIRNVEFVLILKVASFFSSSATTGTVRTILEVLTTTTFTIFIIRGLRKLV